MSHGDGGTECPDCHLPHESTYPHLLRSPYPEASYAQFSLEIYGICWECHDSSLATAKMTEKTGFRQGRRNFHYSHLHKRKGMTCRICHEPHANDRPFLIRSTLAREDAGWSGEMRFVISREGGSCIGGCHKDLSYSR
jgi:nitrate/TMAO reductase-like tetraheme cytochrome c subunit